MQYLKIAKKVSEYIMQIVLKGCVILVYDIIGIHFHVMRNCKDLTTTKKIIKLNTCKLFTKDGINK